MSILCFRGDTSKENRSVDLFHHHASLHAAISVLKDKEPGCFIVRDSHSFRGAYGLAMKVATPPPSVLQQTKKGTGDVNDKHFVFNRAFESV